ncbi:MULTISPECIES: hypothetical protein [unclassified Pseudomonas]|uniref:hypothetical protein n=1 Tax=unclassified Pseudomonas TaxID=196821 RepID=UPI000C885FC3|nr:MULTISPECIES: hypothetical protein [unclassified Pseudomonas]PMX22192.1 hypothetical protein C1Y23_20180 [Pseudomonas sp. GW460-12]PMX31638.1 hypothetical protein C1Y24_24050 [Pseudomonas sp. MPR-R2A4]PMX40554.1 hypothetical protein C1Y26_14375 [Pseudomonas sp. MPR-R2A7]PMX50561.1 hypothetical protein C1Y17_25720 [Pseudomonas sp. MPR-R2A6]PMX85787.1 hypothetical protein C1Y21_25610 [Pseudomonas sp. MPR-R2A3]
MTSDLSIILPQAAKNLVEDTTSYWAAFYCSILKTIRYQKNLAHGWGSSKSLQDYKGELRESGFFKGMKNTVSNHAFEYVMVDFLKTRSGLSHFKKLCENILSDFDINGFDITLMNIFKVGTDSELFNANANYDKTDLLMLLPGGIKAKRTSIIQGYSIGSTLKYSDLFIIISNGEETIGFVGEVEGNHGEDLYRQSYYEKNTLKNKHCTFGVSVSDKKTHAGTSIKNSITLNRSEIVGRWILNFSKSNYYITDYHHAIENLQNLIEGHFGYMSAIADNGHTKILDLIKLGWKKDIFDLINQLEGLVDLALSGDIFHYQETIEGKTVYRASPLELPGELPLYAIVEEDATAIIGSSIITDMYNP